MGLAVIKSTPIYQKEQNPYYAYTTIYIEEPSKSSSHKRQSTAGSLTYKIKLELKSFLHCAISGNHGGIIVGEINIDNIITKILVIYLYLATKGKIKDETNYSVPSSVHHLPGSISL
jgi:hypothetical protein